MYYYNTRLVEAILLGCPVKGIFLTYVVTYLSPVSAHWYWNEAAFQWFSHYMLVYF